MLINRRCQLSLNNKMLVYKITIPIRTYGIQLWGSVSNSNLDVLLASAPWFVCIIPTIKEEILLYRHPYQQRLDVYPDHMAIVLLDNSSVIHSLKRHQILDLGHRFVIQ